MADKKLELGVGELVVVTVAGADAPALALEGLEDGSVRLLPPGGEGTPGPFAHRDSPARGAPPPPTHTKPHR